MNGWFLAVIIIYVLGLGMALNNHGEKQTGKYNFWASLFSVCLLLGLIYMAIKTGF